MKKKPGLRMSELVEATGLPKSTLLYYVDQGLLPPPVKTSPNMAYYSPKCVARVQQIKNLQSRHRIPLEKIKLLLEAQEEGQDINHLIELNAAIFGEDKGPLMNIKELCRASGLKMEQVQALQKAKLLLPLNQEVYDQEDLALARIYAVGAAMGLDVEEMSFYPRLAKQIVDGEMKVRRRITQSMPEDQDAAQTMELLRAARAMRAYIIDRLFQLRVAAAKSLKDESLLSEGDE